MENNQQTSPIFQSININTNDNDSKMDLKNLLNNLLQHWLWFVVALAVCLLGAFLYLRYSTPVYEISSKILIKDDKGGSSASSQDLLDQLDIFNTTSNVNNEKQVLQTYYLVEKVVNALQLNVTYFSTGKIKSTELYNNCPFRVQIISIKDSIPTQEFTIETIKNNRLFTIRNDNLDKKYHFNDTIKTANVSFVVQSIPGSVWSDNDYRIVINTPDVTTEKYLQALSFDIVDKQASVIAITLQETVPRKGEDILNKLYELYTLMNEEDKNKIADSTINFIDERLAVVSNQLANVENDIEQFKVKNQLSTDILEQEKLALNNASTIQQQITSQDVQINVVQSIEDHLKGNSQRIVPNAAVIQDPTYITTVQEYNALVLERDRQLQTTKLDNPVVQNLNSQINAVKNVLLTSLENIKRQMQISRNELAVKNAQFLTQIKSGPAKERAVTDISRQQNVQEQLYLYLLQKREETAISKSGTLANSRLIEPAKSASLPFTPNKSLIYLIAFCAGVILPAGGIYLKYLLNNTITDSSDITKETNVPILGELGHNTTPEIVIIRQDSRTALSEQLRIIRTNLQFVLKGKDKQVILITSSMGNEGKTFFSINLACSLAISGKKVLLMEMDLRKPKISNQINLSIDNGFSDYIAANLEKRNLAKATGIHPNLFLISSGSLPPNPAELLLDDKVEELFTYLKTQYDYIIVDTPPVSIVTDAVLLSKYVDSSIYIVRQNFTSKQQIEIINDLVKRSKLPNLSILINDVKPKKGYGYGYGYRYGYTNGYYTDKKDKNRAFKKNIEIS